ncbi:GntR family transcriptional regulator [Streptomyces sp. 3MP-14]|uniref:GntR family transcriptional regulator n=1 Tax=Streptomyces mimosae TaxID=2586635 RepID=A0A5N6AIG5_9ACTN|nr:MULTISPECIES: GntR family transcriptional regulator [Streptomyces]KAB8167853.1 GntR family transcriptional regulator [Streptomyces mimosae]KAB8177499.1 GntR family transcriptional regulator [Streptomyces sp. 3MP-14]
MLFRVTPDSPVPLGEQIAACVRGAIADGSAQPGERLPPARSLAGSLGVNVHTVLRGYQRLRDEGLVELRRGRGTVVTGRTDAPGLARLLTLAAELVAEARALGVGDEEILRLVASQLPTAAAESGAH